MKRKRFIYLILPIFLVAFLLPTFSHVAQAQTPEPTPPVEPTQDSSEEGGVIEGVIPTRTPVPTATPDRLQRAVSEMAGRAGLGEVSILGLPPDNWLDLLTSVLMVFVGYIVGTWLIRRLLPRLARRTPTEFDDRLLAIVGSDIRWLVVLFILQFAIVRLSFISVVLKSISRDIIFLVALIIGLRIAWKLIKFAEQWFTEKASTAEREEEMTPVIKLFAILGRVFTVTVGFSILLSHFGIDVTLFLATLGISGLALSLGARDLITDLLGGITILIDRPFRIGDRIEIEAIDTWGDVIDIGLRTTRIRTRDNRLVIVPNANIASNEVINYTYPDPTYRFQTHVGVAYGTDVETVRRIIIGTVAQIEQVLSDQPVEALYVEMGDSAMIFRVRWWMGSYVDTRRILDKVHTNVQAALDSAGIKIPFPQRDLHLEIKPKMADALEENKD